MKNTSLQLEPHFVEKGTIAICFVKEALEGIRHSRMDENAILKQAGIRPDLLQISHARVSATHYGRLWHAIAHATDDEFFGMDSHRMKQGSFTLLCHAVIHSDTLERALHRALRFMRLVLDRISGQLSRAEGVARIVLTDFLPDSSSTFAAPPNRPFAYGTFLLILHGLACWLIGRRIPLNHAHFRCAEPSYSDEWRVLFTGDLSFDQSASGIAFSSHYLDMPVMQTERSMKEFLRSAPANFLVKYKNSTNFTARIRRQLRNVPPSAWPDFLTVARHLNLSSATLRRRLEDEGSTYRTITADLRRDLAIMLLSDSDRSTADIAEYLGFAELSAFYRAFKKWTGSAPGDYRRVSSVT